MSLLFADRPTAPRNKLDLDFLHRMECKACPLAQLRNYHPNMPPTGSDKPLVYVLGEAPGKEEDEEGEQFVGASGRILRPHIPRQYRDRVRFNNVVRTRPLHNETPSPTAMEACRPSIVRDIEKTRPRAIFGFGDVPLRWVSEFSGITHWRGRRMPVKVGQHTCWYYAMLHPAFLIYEGRRGESDIEKVFARDLKRAWAEIEDLPPPVVHDPQRVFDNITCITEGGNAGLRRVAAALDWAAAQPDIGVDYETDRLRPYSKDARLLTAAVDDGERGYAFPLEHPDARWTPDELDVLRALWVSFLSATKGRRWVHNLSFEQEWTAVKFGRECLRKAHWEDTATQAVILDERVGGKRIVNGEKVGGCLSLEFLVQQHFGFNLKKLTQLDRSALAQTPVELVLRYNGADARYHKLLGMHQQKLLKKAGLQAAYELSRRKPTTVVLSQVKGVPVDQAEVRALRDKYEERLDGLEKKIAALPVVREFELRKREKFKPLSTHNVLYVFRDILKRSECTVVEKYTKKVKYSVDESVLEQIDHPLADLVVRYRKANKQLSTYIYPLLWGDKSCVLHDDRLIHTNFNTLFAETGRLSSDEPNLQNFPKRDGEAKEVRRPIKAPPGCIVAAFDYGQIEARVIAMFTQDKRFVKALWEDYDVHYEWAERIAYAYPARVGGKKNLTDKKVMKDFRTDIKNQWTFPLFFGAKLESAAGYLGIPVEVLRPLYDEFWRQFSGVRQWQESQVEFYNQHGYVACLTGRRRHGPLSLNQIMNSPVQGTAAEIVLDGMSRLSETEDPTLQPEINIHDDLTYCRIPIKALDDVAEKVIDAMLNVPFEWAKIVPISVEMAIGENWMELEEIGTFSSDKWRR